MERRNEGRPCATCGRWECAPSLGNAQLNFDPLTVKVDPRLDKLPARGLGFKAACGTAARPCATRGGATSDPAPRGRWLPRARGRQPAPQRTARAARWRELRDETPARITQPRPDVPGAGSVRRPLVLLGRRYRRKGAWAPKCESRPRPRRSALSRGSPMSAPALTETACLALRT